MIAVGALDRLKRTVKVQPGNDPRRLGWCGARKTRSERSRTAPRSHRHAPRDGDPEQGRCRRLVLGGILVVLGTGLINRNAQLNTRMNDLNTRIGDLRAEINARLGDLDGDVERVGDEVSEMGERLRNVEIEFAKVDQRLLALERAVIPTADGED